jgi:restriction endonuclease S subunit
MKKHTGNTMSHEPKKAVKPKLRFAEFKDALEWEEKKIGEKVDLLSGFPFDGADILEDSRGLRLLRGINITEGVIRHNQNIDRYYLGNIDKLEKYRLKINDLVIAMDGSKVGKNTALISSFDVNTLLVQRVARLRTNYVSSIQFIFQHINSSIFHAYVDKINTSSGIPHISAKQINDFSIYFPSLEEQQKIADCLSSLDNLITAQAQKLESLEVHKKGLMQQLFPSDGETIPKLRFLEFRDAGEWEEKKLDDVCDIQRGKFSHRPRNEPRFFGGKYPFIQTGDIVKANGGIVKASQSLNELGLTVSKLFKPTIVLITVAANIGDTGILDYEACFTDSVVGLVPNDQISPYFLQLVMSGKKDYLNTIAPAAAQKNINNEILREVDILIPSLLEQQKIADCLSSLDQLITAQKQKLETLKTHKKGLMQQLFPQISEGTE